MPFPAVTVCNQNRVHCKKLEDAKNFCEEIKNMSIPERNNHSRNSNAGPIATQKSEADYTICDKKSVSGMPIVEYLFEEGKCGQICRNGNVLYICC